MPCVGPSAQRMPPWPIAGMGQRYDGLPPPQARRLVVRVPTTRHASRWSPCRGAQGRPGPGPSAASEPAAQCLMRERCVSGLPGTRWHERDRVRCRDALTREVSTTWQRRAPTGKDSIPLLKRVSQPRRADLPDGQRSGQLHPARSGRPSRDGGGYGLKAAGPWLSGGHGRGRGETRLPFSPSVKGRPGAAPGVVRHGWQPFSGAGRRRGPGAAGAVCRGGPW